ncbi:MAG TPA: PIG-L family deacetylase [Planctomycetota bacterium]|nr:PIG-L family deacetylase [Planctomycetota bacterium]
MPTVLAIMAHPDDIEITCAGTLALLKQAGWSIYMATMTAGDLGSMTLTREKIASVRRKEAAKSAALLGAKYACLDFADLTICYGEEAKRRVSGVLRDARPDVIITHPPQDYMADHEETCRLVREAAFASTIPNWKASFNGKSTRPCEKLPAILYADPIENVDHDGRRVSPHYVVDISDVIELKSEMLAAHASQRDWLRAQHGEDEYIHSMRRWSEDRAKDFGRKTVRFAEGFRQHLGHAFPAQDVLSAALGKERVKSLR